MAGKCKLCGFDLCLEYESNDGTGVCPGCVKNMTDCNQVALKVKLLSETARAPTYATDGSAGLDLYCDNGNPINVYFGDKPAEIGTGIAIEIPAGYVGLIKSRSGLAFKKGLFGFDGVIDSDYRGEIRLLLTNRGNMSCGFKQGDRVAQLLVVPCPKVQVVCVDKLDSTERGGAGFGSSGR